MIRVASYVFFDLETTGLPHLERNQTKITELCFIAISRKDLEDNISHDIMPISKLNLLFNPQREIQAKAAEITGLTNNLLHNSPLFKDKINTILAFLNDLPKPVCLVAHNGDIFDYKILLTEFEDVSMELPFDLLCVDSLKAFKSLLNTDSDKDLLNTSRIVNDSLTDSDWLELDLSSEDLNHIDSLCESFSDLPTSETSTPHRKRNVKDRNTSKRENIKCFNLQSLYKRLLNKEVVNAHRAEGDCIMLSECVSAAKGFLQWADGHCKTIHSIEPLDRKKYRTFAKKS